MTTLETVQKILANQLNLDTKDITPEKEVVKDLGADSLDVVEILMTMSEEYGVEIPDEEAMEIKTVQDIVDRIDKNS